jgi:hypothetical protein
MICRRRGRITQATDMTDTHSRQTNSLDTTFRAESHSLGHESPSLSIELQKKTAECRKLAEELESCRFRESLLEERLEEVLMERYEPASRRDSRRPTPPPIRI